LQELFFHTRLTLEKEWSEEVSQVVAQIFIQHLLTLELE
jgi:hypothetical protein